MSALSQFISHTKYSLRIAFPSFVFNLLVMRLQRGWGTGSMLISKRVWAGNMNAFFKLCHEGCSKPNTHLCSLLQEVLSPEKLYWNECGTRRHRKQTRVHYSAVFKRWYTVAQHSRTWLFIEKLDVFFFFLLLIMDFNDILKYVTEYRLVLKVHWLCLFVCLFVYRFYHSIAKTMRNLRLSVTFGEVVLTFSKLSIK